MMALTIVDRFINKPIALRQDWATLPISALANYLGASKVTWGEHLALAFPGDDETTQRRAGSRKLYDCIEGVALIQVAGILVQKLGAPGPAFGFCGYDYIRLALAEALDDQDVSAILLDVDSPGGEVAGLFDLTDMIYRARSMKPIWAVLSETAASAAYAIAAAAAQVTIPRTGIAGSIGIIAMHVDLSRALDAAGITVTLLTYGAHKADRADTSPLSKQARRRFQAEVDTLGELFVERVARYRVKSASAIRAQQAATYMGSDAISAGLADTLMSPADALNALLERVRRNQFKPRRRA